VTGCAGFIGSQLTESLLEDGHDIVGLDGFIDTYAADVKLDNLQQAKEFDSFSFVEADLTEVDLRPLVEKSEVIFHLAAEPGVRTSWGHRFESYTRNNVLATQRLLEAVKDVEGRRVVFASSSSIYGDAEVLPTPEDVPPRPFSPYGVTKLAAEHLCALYGGNYGVDAVALRYFSTYGPRQRPDMAFHRFCRAAVCGEPLTLFGTGEQTRDFTFVADVVAATRAAAEAPAASGEAYNVGGGSRVSVNEAIDLIGSFAGRPLEVHRLEPEKGDVRNTGADTSKARRDLGFNPMTSVAAGLEAEFEWMVDRVSAASGKASSPARPVR
jgi:UDP-glucuronate 4-epimerase